MPGSQRRKLRHQAARELEDEMEQTQEVLEQLEGFLHAMKRGKGMGVIRGARSGEKSGTKKRGR